MEAVVLETARGGLIRDGLAATGPMWVLSPISAKITWASRIDTLEDLAQVKALVVEAVPSSGYAVLNADDSRRAHG